MPGDRYSIVAIVLHWVIAAAIIFQLVLGWRSHELRTTLEGFTLIQLHKSVGITILALSLLRLGWRLANPPPQEPESLASWERRLSVATHWGFYIVMIGMPITGWMMVSTSRIEIPTLLFGTIPWPHLPGLSELAAPAKAAWNGAAARSHDLLGWGAWGLLALHVAGALKHQLFAKDEPILARMAPGAKAGRWLEPRLLVILVAACAVFAAGALVSPKVKASKPPPAPIIIQAPPVADSAPVPAAAAPEPVAKPQGPSVWKVSPGSTLAFTTTFSGTVIAGRFQRWTADIVFDPEALDLSHVQVAIDLASADTGDAQRDQMLPSADWFDAASHARATYSARTFQKVGEGRYVAKGRLTLRGVSKPLDLPFRLKIDGDTARVTGITSLDRTAFGVGQGEWTSTDQIPARVTVSVDLTAKRR